MLVSFVLLLFKNDTKSTEFTCLSYFCYLSIFSEQFDKPIGINFTYGDENEVFANTSIIKPLAAITFKPHDNQSISMDLTGTKVGHLVIGAESSDVKM